jgi:hypothetical protein
MTSTKLVVTCEIDGKSPVRAYHEAGRIVLRAAKWIGIDGEGEILIRTGLRFGRSNDDDISFHFMRASHLGEKRDFDTEMIFWNDRPTLVLVGEEVVIKIINETSDPVTVSPGECLGVIFAIKPLFECEIKTINKVN